MTPNTDIDTAIRDVSPQIVDVEVDDEQNLARVVQLHMELLDFGPLAGLGARFIREVGYKMHMANGSLKVALCSVAEQPVGFVAYTSDSTGFHRQSLSANWLRICLILLLSFLEAPSRLAYLPRALKTIASRRKEKELDLDPIGEIVAIAAKREFLTNDFLDVNGRRISTSLIAYVQRQLQETHVQTMRMLVDADNKCALFLYHGLGAHMKPYEQSDEPMVEVSFDLDGQADMQNVPSCWLKDSRNFGEADGWDEYWECLNDEKPIFKVEARDYVLRLRQAISPISQSRVLDFGCGFGIVSEFLAPYVGELAIWDGAVNMRRNAHMRLKGLEKIRFLDLSLEDQDTAAGVFDLILVNSVIQYMSTEQLDGWLSRWKSILRSDGRIVVSDIVGPDYRFVHDLFAFMRICFQNGVLLRSFWKGLKEIGNYSSFKASRPLLSMDAGSIEAAATKANLAVEILPVNLTYHAGRLTAVFRN